MSNPANSYTHGTAQRLDIIKDHLVKSSLNTIQPVAMAAVGSPLTTHILDTARGAPASGVPIKLYRRAGSGTWMQISQGETNADGRMPGLLTKDSFQAGVYKMFFDTSVYFAANKVDGFYPYVEVVFEVKDPSNHHHVPLLLSPYGYSTYRGS